MDAHNEHVLFSVGYDGHTIAVAGNAAGLEQIVVDDEVVSATRNLYSHGEHVFNLPDTGDVHFAFQLQPEHASAIWALRSPAGVVARGEEALINHFPRIPGARPENLPAPSRTSRALAVGGAGFKLFKSAGAVKVALAGSAFAGWSLLFDWRFAAMIISILVFHEYGHIRAMKRFGIAIKGIYLIPFFGGAAVGDRARTHWQEVYIAILGPVYGLIMCVAALIAWWLTNIEILGQVATFGALINLFNLLPIYPLDGGRVLKAIAWSANPNITTPFLLVISAVAFATTAWAGLWLLSFFLVFGVIDLLGSRQQMLNDQTLPMDGYGMSVSGTWYAATIAAFLGLMWLMADAVPGGQVPMVMLRD